MSALFQNHNVRDIYKVSEIYWSSSICKIKGFSWNVLKNREISVWDYPSVLWLHPTTLSTTTAILLALTAFFPHWLLREREGMKNSSKESSTFLSSLHSTRLLIKFRSTLITHTFLSISHLGFLKGLKEFLKYGKGISIIPIFWLLSVAGKERNFL